MKLSAFYIHIPDTTKLRDKKRTYPVKNCFPTTVGLSTATERTSIILPLIRILDTLAFHLPYIRRGYNLRRGIRGVVGSLEAHA